MPIAFRCPSCNQMLSISRRRAGTTIKCPACNASSRVPLAADQQEELSAAPDPVTEGEQDKVDESLSERAAPAPSEPAPPAPLSVLPSQSSRPAPPAPARRLTRVRPPSDEDDEEEDDHLKGMKPISDAIDMTAMVDVTFLLLIFFMVTASFAAQKVMETSPPEPDADSGASRATAVMDDLVGSSVVVEVDAENQIKVDEIVVYGLPGLREILAGKLATEQKNEVLIQAEYAASHGVVVSVADVAIDVGMQKIRRTIRKDTD